MINILFTSLMGCGKRSNAGFGFRPPVLVLPARTVVLALILLALMPAPCLSSAARSELFPRPQALQPAIAFWTRVYTEVDSNQGFIHDSRHLERIYQTLTLNPHASWKSQNRQIRKALNRYRKILLALADGRRTHLGAEEQQVLDLWTRQATKKDLRAAAERLRFQRGQADRLRSGLKRSGAWEAQIKSLLFELGLPAELAALPHVESSYNPLVKSQAGAAGLWQLMRATGRRYLRIDHVVDERLDPIKATEAAARLLQHNYSVLKAWPLAITAYNHGLSGVRKAVSRTGSSDIGEIVARYRGRRFGFASRNFYAAFLAAHDVTARSELIFGTIRRDRPARYAQISLPAYVPIDALAGALGADRDVLQRLNPTLRPAVWQGAKYVPKDFSFTIPAFVDRADAALKVRKLALTKGSATQKRDHAYRVRNGDTLSVIAARYDTSVAELMAMNQLRSRHRIRAGQTLRLPEKSEPQSNVAGAKAVKAVYQIKPNSGDYVVRTGDTLSVIAGRLGVSESNLVTANAISDPHLIFPGQTIAIPVRADNSGETNGDEPNKSDQKGFAGGSKQITAVGDTGVTGEQNPPAVETVVAQANLDPSEVAPVEAQPALSADPADYQVDANATIEIQAAETWGHYAVWLDARVADLRLLNGLRKGQPLVVGRRIKLDFANVAPAVFERKRLAYHESIQAGYFDRHHITSIHEHEVREGDSLWLLATRDYDVPLWLLRQFNPDIDFDTLLPPGGRVLIPMLEDVGENGSPDPLKTAGFVTNG